MFFALRLGFTLFNAARRINTLGAGMQRVRTAVGRYRSSAVRVHNDLAGINRHARGAQGHVNNMVRAVDRLGGSLANIGSAPLVSLNITTNVDAVCRDLDKLERDLDAEITRALTAAGSIIAGEAGRSAFEHRYLGQLHRSYAVDVKHIGSEQVAHIGSNLVHAAVQEYGRRPGGKMPPAPEIRQWMVRRGIDASLEYPIRRKIAKKGTPARRHLNTALETKEAEVRQLFERRINAVLSAF